MRKRLRGLRAALAERQRQIDAAHRISQATLYEDEAGRPPAQKRSRVSLETLDANSGSLYTHDPEKHELVFAYVIAEPEVAAVLTGPECRIPRGLPAKFQVAPPRLPMTSPKKPGTTAKSTESRDT